MTDSISKELITKLKGSENYFSWAIDTKSLLMDQDSLVWRYVSNTAPALANNATEEVNERHARAKAKGYRIIVTNVDPSIKALIPDSTEPAIVWRLLKARFGTMEFAQIDVLRRKLRTMKQSDKQPLQDFLNKWDSVRKELAQYGSHPLEYELGGELIRSLNRSFEKSIEYLFGSLQVAVDKATAEVDRINDQATAQITPAAANAAEQAAAGHTTADPTVGNAGAAAAALALTANQEREAAISLAKSRIIEEIITAIYRSEANSILIIILTRRYSNSFRFSVVVKAIVEAAADR